MDLFIDHQEMLRAMFFLLIFCVLAVAEFLFPLSKRKSPRRLQWAINLSLSVINTLCVKIAVPLLAVGAAEYASVHAIGLFNIFEFPILLSFFLSLLLLDLIIYGQHVLFHHVPVLWKLHRMHHTEIGLDVSSALRFHPIEMILSMLIKVAFVLLLGVPVVAVIIFELLLNSLALFNHSNLKLPASVDKLLRKLIVTPEVHWIHHSYKVRETNSNFGFNLIIWDKLFATYIATPSSDYPEMQQGLSEFGLKKSLSLYALLRIPFIHDRNRR